MVVTLLDGLYPDFVGRRQLFCGNGNGPAAYVTGGDPTTLNNPRLYIDVLFGGVMTVSGNYVVYAVPAGVGVRQTWKLVWFHTTTAGGATVGAQATNGANLSAEQLQVGGFFGQF